MEGEDTSGDDPRSFRNAKLWKRMIVLVAGAAMNFVLGIISIVIMVCMMTDIPTTQILGFAGVKNDDGSKTYYSESYHSGLRHNDEIIKVDNTSIYSVLDLNFMLMLDPTDTEHDLVVKRNGEKIRLDGVKFTNTQTGDKMDFGLVYLEKTPASVLKYSGQTFASMSHIVGLSLKYLVTGQVSKDEVSGPVGVVSTISETTEQAESTEDAIFNLFYMMSLITINLGIFNLLPVPGLDGGRLLFCFIELIRRKPIKPEHEGYVHLAGMVLLFGIMIFATFNDIMRLFEK
jgi:regulator of sigma E protease